MNIIANIALIALLVVYFASFYKIFAKAGRTNKWEGFIPVYNFVIWAKIMKRPWWWAILLLIPGVNFVMTLVMNVELSRTFNLRSTNDTLKAIFIPWLVIWNIGTKNEIAYVGPIDYKGLKRKWWQEWGDALIFAVVAATIIRTFFLEAFKIPTPSMEKNLLVGDMLFVSKISYGARLPMTPMTFPFTHNTIPWLEWKSYLEIYELPYMRLPGFGSVQRNDVVVFNFPAGDTVLRENTNVTYYAVLLDHCFTQYARTVKNPTLKGFDSVKQNYLAHTRKQLLEENKLIIRPLDKKDNYIKRCVGIPGDVLEIKNRKLYVNGEVSGETDEMQFFYNVKMKESNFMTNKTILKEKFDINRDEVRTQYGPGTNEVGNEFEIPLTESKKAEFEKQFNIESIKPNNKEKGYYHDHYLGSTPDHQLAAEYLHVFPNDIQYDWTEDNFGPLTVPSEGSTVKINKKTLPLYRRIIEVYEGNELSVKGNDILINGEKATEYTFKQDYYWLMGDNRHNSLDSRFWGFVPADHIVGKAVLIWFSSDPETGIRWNRIFKTIE